MQGTAVSRVSSSTKLRVRVLFCVSQNTAQAYKRAGSQAARHKVVSGTAKLQWIKVRTARYKLRPACSCAFWVTCVLSCKRNLTRVTDH